MVHRQRGVGELITRDGRQRYLPLDGRQHINIFQPLRPLPVLRRNFEHHAVLITLGVNGRYQRLTKGQVQCGVDGAYGDAEACGAVTVDGQRGLQTAHLLVAVDVREFRHILQRILQAWRPRAQVFEVIRAQRELVSSVALPPTHADILHRIQKQRRPRHRTHLGAQPCNHFIGSEFAFLHRL